MTAAVWTAIAFGIPNLVIAVIALFRAGRAATLIERSERRAVVAEQRADAAEKRATEAHTQNQERAEAELLAPDIVETWLTKMRAQRVEEADSDEDILELIVTTANLAEKLAVNILRTNRAAFHVGGVQQAKDKALIAHFTVKRIATNARHNMPPV